MIHIKDIGARDVTRKSGIKRQMFAEFKCEICSSIVERVKSDGLKQKSCCLGFGNRSDKK